MTDKNETRKILLTIVLWGIGAAILITLLLTQQIDSFYTLSMVIVICMSIVGSISIVWTDPEERNKPFFSMRLGGSSKKEDSEANSDSVSKSSST